MANSKDKPQPAPGQPGYVAPVKSSTPDGGYVSSIEPLGANSVAGNSVGGRQPDQPVPKGVDATLNSDGTPQKK